MNIRQFMLTIAIIGVVLNYGLMAIVAFRNDVVFAPISLLLGLIVVIGFWETKPEKKEASDD